MTNLLLWMSFLTGLLPLHASEETAYTINGKPITDFPIAHDAHFDTLCFFAVKPEENTDTAFITINGPQIKLSWVKATIDYETLAEKRLSSIDDQVPLQQISMAKVTIRSKLIGDAKSDVIIESDQGNFSMVSLTFKDQFYLLSPEEPAFRGLRCKKRPRVNYPLIDGKWDFNNSANVLQSQSSFLGFLVGGCDIEFAFASKK